MHDIKTFLYGTTHTSSGTVHHTLKDARLFLSKIGGGACWARGVWEGGSYGGARWFEKK